MKVFICANFSKGKSVATVKAVCDKLIEIGFTPMLDKAFREDFAENGVTFDSPEILLDTCDMIITVGGDGTIIKWGRYAAKYKKPLLGINTGRLGFMTTLECDDIEKLRMLKTGNYKISNRMLLEVSHSNSDDTYVAVNDVVFTKNRYAKLPEFSISVDGYEVSRIRADGIIFSTPTGSTAYSLSAGGPIITPDAQCIEFTPLCPHSLFGRPMIFSSDSEILVSFKGYENSGVIFNVDGDDDLVFEENDCIKIRKSSLTLNLVHIDGGGFYNAVHNKLMAPLK